MAEKDGKITYLNDPQIAEWARPGIQIPAEQGSTTILASYGFRTVNELVRDQMRVYASAEKFIANIKRSGESSSRRAVLFVGGISVYDWGTIPGTQTCGNDLVANGEIYAAVPVDGQNESTIGLEHLLYGSQTADSREKLARVQAIVRGYRSQIEESTSEGGSFGLSSHDTMHGRILF